MPILKVKGRTSKDTNGHLDESDEEMKHLWGPRDKEDDTDEAEVHYVDFQRGGRDWEGHHWRSIKGNIGFFNSKMKELKEMNGRGEHCFVCTMICFRLYIYLLRNEFDQVPANG
jgi:hypothetical protein